MYLENIETNNKIPTATSLRIDYQQCNENETICIIFLAAISDTRRNEKIFSKCHIKILYT